MKAIMTAMLLATAACGSAQGDSTLVAKLGRLAAMGDPAALYYLGMAYQTGSGVELDHRRALEYFRQSAAAGDPLGAYKLGCFYAGQNGVLPVDEEQALANKLVAARAGYALAQTDVASIYARRGQPEMAREWLSKAAAQGYSDALFGMASLHNGKSGLPRDSVMVIAYFTLFMDRVGTSAEQRAWLAEQEKAATTDELARARRFVRDYRAIPTVLTISALSGQQAAERLVAKRR